MHLVEPVNDRDYRQGNPTAPITLLEYGNYQCLRCQDAHFNIQEIQRWLDRYLQFVYRDFAFACSYPNSEYIACSAYAAGAQGKFWQMHNYLVETLGEYDLDYLMQAALNFGLDLQQFQFAIVNHSYRLRILENWKSGISSGVKQTPTFFINGIRHQGSWDVDSLMEAIEQVGLEYELRNLYISL
jgi:protein-disulfide isomerase